MDGFSALAGRTSATGRVESEADRKSRSFTKEGAAACQARLYPTRFKVAGVDNKERYRFQANESSYIVKGKPEQLSCVTTAGMCNP